MTESSPATRPLTILQMLPALHAGGVERGTLEISRYLVQAGLRSLVMSAGGRMLPQLLEEGGKHFDWPIGKKSLWSLRLVAPLRQFLLENQVDILHVRSRMPAWIAWLAWRGMDAKTRPRLVTTVHGAYTVNAYSAIMTRGERVIAVSNTIRDYLTQNYPKLDMARVRVIHRGVDAQEFPYEFQPDPSWLEPWRRRHPGLTGLKLLTLPGRLTRWKGQMDFVALIERLKQAGLPIHGLIVGDPDPGKAHFLQELQTRIAALNLMDNITLIGHRSDLREILSLSSLVLSLSQEPEAFGRTVPEALSLGIPVIGYDHGGVGEVLRAWYPQGLTPATNLDALEDTVQRLLADPVPVPRQNDYSLENMQARTLDVYRELLAESR